MQLKISCNCEVPEEDQRRALQAARDFLAERGIVTDAQRDAAYAEFEAAIEAVDFSDYDTVWAQAERCANHALTMGWTKLGDAECVLFP